MLDKFERFVAEPEIVEMKEKMLVIEANIKEAAEELTWGAFLEWELLWAGR
ncbi:hypothetical protein [Tumebacillus permanentifrigoris]|uniref:Uncharacterized protein n=1 Tax=Tumebacillus permanentifrigoris TaxID=378543 RepID=A0A316DB33_9BACL|nr:hypothetical protein [Tumebacillus permanentifrigoris]PWK14938.1 hypothetical protein C7459_104140 [Tumebacillus permanentifrigoris]